MVFEFKGPESGDMPGPVETAPVLLVYLPSFLKVGLFRNNHHHTLHAVEWINGLLR